MKYIKLLIFIVIAFPFQLFADDVGLVEDDYIDADSVVIIRYLAINPQTVIKILVTNEDLRLASYRNNHSRMICDIDISTKLYDEVAFKKVIQLSVADEIFNEIKHNLFQDINALYIEKNDSNIISRKKLFGGLGANNLFQSFLTKEERYTYRISVEVYKNGNCDITSIKSKGFFTSENGEVMRDYYSYSDRYQDYYIEYSPFFVDFYNLINELISDFEKKNWFE